MIPIVATFPFAMVQLEVVLLMKMTLQILDLPHVDSVGGGTGGCLMSLWFLGLDSRVFLA